MMQRTLFNTPVLSPLLRQLSVAFLKWTGWTVEGQLPADTPKAVMVAAPHTSNWDLPYMLMVCFALHAQIRWMGKSSLFRAPFGGLMRWLGGLPVDRSQANQLVAASVDALRRAEGTLQLVIAPEGTRSAAQRWKTGFHHIARGAGVPIVLTYLDFAGKRSGIGPLFQPSSDVEADIATIKAFYAPFKGRNPQQFDAG